MTVAQLIIELRKLDQSTEVWVDTSDGLFPADMVYQDSDTVVLTYTDQLRVNTVKDYN